MEKTIERETKERNTYECEQCGMTCEKAYQEYLVDAKRYNWTIDKTRDDFEDYVAGPGGVCTEECSADWGPQCEACHEDQDRYL